MTESEVTLLPQPDSPTRPTVRPRGTLKLMPSTARNRPRSVAEVGLEAANLEERFHQNE